MKNITILLVIFSFVIVSCSKTIIPEKPIYEKKVITLHFKANHRLNLINEQAHSLHIAIYQLTDPNPFNQLTEDKTGLEQLLKSEIFDMSVASVRSIVVYPTSDVVHKLDRAEGAKYLGLVAGYEIMDKKRMVRLYKIPVSEKKTGIFNIEIELKLEPLNIEAELGAQQIETDRMINTIKTK